jgi:hypothetical protein
VTRVAGALVALLALLLPASPAGADTDPSALFGAGAKALHDGRAADAITSFESLADQGVVDAAASYDRGLAYATRVHIGAEVPGDLGRAAHGFEEARDLSRDARLAEDAARALGAIHSEVARRRARAGEPAEVDPGRSLARTIAHLSGEDTWTWLAAFASIALSGGLFVRWLASDRRWRVGGGVSAGVAAPVLGLAIALTLLARHDRLHLREAVVVTPNARPSDERGLTLPGARPLPEASRVEIVDQRAALTRVRFGSIDAWLPTGALRELAAAR